MCLINCDKEVKKYTIQEIADKIEINKKKWI